MVLTPQKKEERKAKTAARREMKETRKKYKTTKQRTEERTGSAYKIRTCKHCDIHTTSAADWENHVAGKRHLQNLADSKPPPTRFTRVRTRSMDSKEGDLTFLL